MKTENHWLQTLVLWLAWIPGHMEIADNEKADKAVKEAAKSKTGNINFIHKPLKSSRSNIINQITKKDWQEAWKIGKDDAKHLRRITTKVQDQESKSCTTESLIAYPVCNRRDCVRDTVRWISTFTDSALKNHHYANAGKKPSKILNTIDYTVQDMTNKGPNSGKRRNANRETAVLPRVYQFYTRIREGNRKISILKRYHYN
jgi:hypothetical protein